MEPPADDGAMVPRPGTAWPTSSPATVGGALGAGLEQDEVVREAAYTHRADDVPEPRAA